MIRFDRCDASDHPVFSFNSTALLWNVCIHWVPLAQYLSGYIDALIGRPCQKPGYCRIRRPVDNISSASSFRKRLRVSLWVSIDRVPAKFMELTVPYCCSDFSAACGTVKSHRALKQSINKYKNNHAGQRAEKCCPFRPAKQRFVQNKRSRCLKNQGERSKGSKKNSQQARINGDRVFAGTSSPIGYGIHEFNGLNAVDAEYLFNQKQPENQHKSEQNGFSHKKSLQYRPLYR